MTAAWRFNVHGHDLKMDVERSAQMVMCDTVQGLFLGRQGLPHAGKAIFALELMSCEQNGLRPYLSPAHRHALTDRFLIA